MLRENHPPIINFSFFIFICINMSWCACPLLSPVTQTLPLSKESKESLVYIHVCVSRFWEKSGFGEQVGSQARLPLNLLFCRFTLVTRAGVGQGDAFPCIIDFLGLIIAPFFFFNIRYVVSFHLSAVKNEVGFSPLSIRTS